MSSSLITLLVKQYTMTCLKDRVLSGARIKFHTSMLGTLGGVWNFFPQKIFLFKIKDCVETTKTSKGVAQMSTLLHKSYLVKVSTKGEGVKNAPNFIYVVCTQPLTEYYLIFALICD